MKIIISILYLLKLCTQTKSGKIGLAFMFSIIGLELLGIQLALSLIEWNKDFYNALEKYDINATVKQVGIFLFLIALSSTQYLIGNYFRSVLLMRWRKELTYSSLNLWLDKKNYWYLSEQSQIDNPDQRIAEDCRLFVERFTKSAIDLVTRIVGLITYFVVLWNITDFALHLNILGKEVVIEHYLVWLAPIYVFISSLVTHYLGAPLMRLNVDQKKKEADFRFSMARFRESKEAIALQNGEEAEKNILHGRFSKVEQNWTQLIRREFILGCFTRPYESTIFRIPLLFSLPIYLIGKASLGTLMQIASAFQNVTLNLSWFIFSYARLTEMAAAAVRLHDFLKQLQNLESKSIEQDMTLQEASDSETLAFNKVQLNTVDGQTLLDIDHKVLGNDYRMTVIKGASGIGKSTLFKVLAGLHLHYTGEVTLPTGKLFFLPQRAYFPVGGLLSAVAYPQIGTEKDEQKINHILSLVGFHNQQIQNLLHDCDFSKLSGGEQQRLIIARVIFNQPDWVFLDESCNALDEVTELKMFKLLREHLPNARIVLISHTNNIDASLGSEEWQLSKGTFA